MTPIPSIRPFLPSASLSGQSRLLSVRRASAALATYFSFLVATFHVHGENVGKPKLLNSPSTTIPDNRNYAPRINYKTQMEDYFATMQGKPCDLIFIGDSITEQWRWGTGKSVWDKYFSACALDFGLGSDTTQNAIWRLKNLPVEGFKLKAAVVLIGTNNFRDTSEDIAAGVQAVLDATSEKFPGIKIILVSILPNARAKDKMATTNTLIEKIANQRTIFYLDLASKLTLEGDNWKGLGKDKLHLTTEGYEIWATELNQLLPQVLR